MTIEFIRDQAFGTKDAFFMTKYKDKCIVNEHFDNAEDKCSAKMRHMYLSNRKMWQETATDLSYCFCGL